MSKKKNYTRPRAALDLDRVEKGELIPDFTAPKSYLLFLSTTVETLRTVKTGKIASRRVSLLAS